MTTMLNKNKLVIFWTAYSKNMLLWVSTFMVHGVYFLTSYESLKLKNKKQCYNDNWQLC